MSLFRLKEWWRSKQGQGEEEFDQGSLVVANVDNSQRNVKVITGSFSGVLRIFQPQGRTCCPADQLLEQQLPHPILHLAVGRFSAAAPASLAVLHPQSLVIYQVTRPTAHLDENIPFLELHQLHHHTLSHTAANFCHGPFGGAPDQDSILVQAFDGQVYIFEHGQLVQTTVFEDFLLPGPISYVRETDAVVTCNSAFELQSYAYRSLAHAVGTEPDLTATGCGLAQRKAPLPQWALSIGELAVDIQLLPSGDARKDATDIVVVGERTILVCSTLGLLKAQWRLDYHPSATIAYRVPDGSYNLLVGTHTCNFIIYRGTRVVWLAKGPTVPVAIRVAPVAGLDAALVILDDEGLLSVCYIGTAPPTAVLGLSEHRETDWADVHARRQELARIIRGKEPGQADADSCGPAKARGTHGGGLHLQSQVPRVMPRPRGDFGQALDSGSDGQTHSRSCEVKLFIRNTGTQDVLGVHVSAQSQPPVTVSCGASLARLRGSRTRTPVAVALSCACSGAAIPSSRTVEVTATAADADGNQLCTWHEVCLPLPLFVQAVPPVKSNSAKLTLSLPVAPPRLSQLFADVAESSAPEATAHATSDLVMSFRYPGGEECSVLASRNSNKYRVQGSSYQALWLILVELLDRLRGAGVAAEAGGPGRWELGIEERVPLTPLFDCIDTHFALRGTQRGLSLELERAAAQFRLGQKGLIRKYKEVQPTPIGPLLLFLEESHKDILSTADRLDATESALAEARQQVAAFMQLLLLWLRCRCGGMTDADFTIVHAHLCPTVHDAGDIGWEEVADAAILELLRGALARSGQERAALVSVSEPLTACDKFKRHLEILVDRVEAADGGLSGAPV